MITKKHAFHITHFYAMLCVAVLSTLIWARQSRATDDAPEPETTDAAPAQPITIGPMFNSRSINAELETGFIAWNDVKIPGRFMTRIQLGMLRAIDPIFATAGLGLDIGGLRTAALGVHLGVMHYINGFHAQTFFNVALDGTPILGAGVGWSMIGLEYQVAPWDEKDQIVMFKLKIPFGVIMWGIHQMDREVRRRTRQKSNSGRP